MSDHQCLSRPRQFFTLLALLLVTQFLVPRLSVAEDAISQGANAPGAAVDLQLTLPPQAFAVVGEETGVFFDNLVLTQTPADYRFVVTCDVGTASERGWQVTPAAADVGEHAWKLDVFQQDRRLATATMNWKVSPATAGTGRELSLLIVGDSLTHASLYPNDLQRRLTTTPDLKLTMLGTHRPKNALPGVAHEGYGGWTWARFLTHFDRMPAAGGRGTSSPFVFLVNDQPQLDVARTFKELYDGQSPEYVIFLLGINDCFGAKPDDPQALDQQITGVLDNAEKLIAEFRKAAPDAELGIGLTTPGNDRAAAFDANYKGRYTRWGWKRIQHRLVQLELERFSGREQDRIFVIPTELGVDPVAGFPVDNAVHPNATGYQQIAAQMHAWLKWRLSQP